MNYSSGRVRYFWIQPPKTIQIILALINDQVQAQLFYGYQLSRANIYPPSRSMPLEESRVRFIPHRGDGIGQGRIIQIMHIHAGGLF